MLERRLSLVVLDSHLETRTNESPSDTILRKVAAVKETEPTELDSPLYDVIDPDALNTLFAGRNGSSGDGRVSFRYNDCEVSVESDGEVLVRELSGHSADDSTAVE